MAVSHDNRIESPYLKPEADLESNKGCFVVLRNSQECLAGYLYGRAQDTRLNGSFGLIHEDF